MRTARALIVCALFAVAGSACKRQPEVETSLAGLPPVGKNELRPVAAFDVIPDKKQRSAALFLEASRVLLHPRCANCHPDGDSPLQGMRMIPHQPPVARGPDDHGVVAMQCQGCHQRENLEHARVPGAPNWHLAPREMAWVGKTPRYLCEQLKDKKRNGGKSLAELVEHNTHDELVAWGWKPGHGREPAPGDQKQFGAITAAWVATGAECPSEEARP